MFNDESMCVLYRNPTECFLNNECVQEMLIWILLVVVGLFEAEAQMSGPFTPAPLMAGGVVFRTIFDNFCLNYTAQTVTFTGDVPNLYNSSGLPWNQFFSVGNAFPALSGANFACSSLSSLPALPTKLPVPISAFFNGVNAFNDFRFPAQTGTQDTYQVLNPNGIVQAVQLINDATTNFSPKMRFFFKVDFRSISQACSSLGSTFEQVVTQWWTAQPPLQYTADVPIVGIARSSANTIVADPRFFAATQTPNNDLIVAVTGGSHYQLETFLESTFLDTTQCPTGQTQLVLQFGMEYTSQNATYLVQGPRVSPAITIYPNCYNVSIRSVVRAPCSGGVCVSRVQIQTECRTALANGLTFTSCDLGVDAAEELNNEVFFDSYASYCPLSTKGCAQNGTGFTRLYYMDKVRASVAFKAASQFLQVMQFYAAATSPLNHALISNFTLQPGQTVWVAVYFPYPEIQRHFSLSISNSSLFNISATDGAGNVIATLTYPQLVSTGVITTGVKATRASGLLACDAVPGCDSFALNADKAAAVFPGAVYLTFNATTTIPGGYNGQGTLGSLVTSSATQFLLTSFPSGSVSTTSLAQALVPAWVLVGVAGAAIVIVGILMCVYYFGDSAVYSTAKTSL